MPHVIWHCSGNGPIEGYDDVKLPHYKHGISTYAWAPPHDMSRDEVLKVDEKLENLRQKQLRIIADATGGELTGNPMAHESGEDDH